MAQHCGRDLVFFNACDSIWNVFVHDVLLLTLTTGQVLYVYWINIGWGQIFLSNIQTYLAWPRKARYGGADLYLYTRTHKHVYTQFHKDIYLYIYICLSSWNHFLMKNISAFLKYILHIYIFIIHYTYIYIWLNWKCLLRVIRNKVVE